MQARQDEQAGSRELTLRSLGLVIMMIVIMLVVVVVVVMVMIVVVILIDGKRR